MNDDQKKTPKIKSPDRSVAPVNNSSFGYVPPYRHQSTSLISDSLIIDTFLDISQDTIYFKDVDSRFILNDQAHVLQFGVKSPADLVGKTDADFYPETFAKQSRQDELLIMRTGIPILNKMEQGMNASGEILTFSTSKYPLYDVEGKIIGTWGISRDMTKLVKAEEELAKATARFQALSLTDELTHLSNQRHFYNTLDLTIQLFSRKRLGGFVADFCLVFLDIDDFKRINDTYGHVIGDAALRFVAGQMMAHTRVEETCFRYGGDEFAIILSNTNVKEGLKIADRLRKVVADNPLVIDKTTVRITISLGVVAFCDEKNASELVQKADVQLYKAKAEGKNLVR